MRRAFNTEDEEDEDYFDEDRDIPLFNLAGDESDEDL